MRCRERSALNDQTQLTAVIRLLLAIFIVVSLLRLFFSSIVTALAPDNSPFGLRNIVKKIKVLVGL